MSIPYDPNYEDPCLSCRYREQACGYILDGKKYEDACMSVKIWLNHQKKKDAVKCSFCGKTILNPTSNNDDERAAWSNGLCMRCYKSGQDAEWKG